MNKKIAKTVRSRTESDYHTTQKYLQKWIKSKPEESFANFLLIQKIAQATRLKHLRNAETLLRRKQLPDEIGNSPNFGTLAPAVKSPPPVFTDDDFTQLYDAFNDVEYPKFIQPGERHRYWHCILHFASITALRREAILGLSIANVNLQELFIHVPAGIDKKNIERYKAITPELAEEIIQLRRFYDPSMLVPAKRKLLFPWIHGTKCWYRIWNTAEKAIGKRFHLHDLKRYSGELALRAGATPLELQEHMSHANLSTTLQHYTRPKIRELVNRIVVPIPHKSHHKNQHPIFTNPEIELAIKGIIKQKLQELGIENLPNLNIDSCGNAFLDSRTPDEIITEAKKKGLKLYTEEEGGAT